LHLGSWRAPPLPDHADAAQAREAAIMSSAARAVMADAESAARELRVQDQTADQHLTPELLVTADLVRLLLGMKAGDGHVIGEAATRAHAMLRKHGNLSTPPALELAAAGRSLIAADLAGAAQALERALIPGHTGFDPGLVAAHAVGQATVLLVGGDLNGARAVMNRASSRSNLPLLPLLRETLLADIETTVGRPNAALGLLRGYQDSDLAVLVALPRARAFVALHDWPRAERCVHTVLTATSTLVSRYNLLEAMLWDARIAQLKDNPGRALEMIAAAMELAQDDIVLPFFAMQGEFASLLVRHPVVAAQWPLPPGGVPVDEVMPGGRPSAAEFPDPLTEREHAALRFLATGLS